MNTGLIIVGLVLIMLSAILTIITFGFGIACTWPFLLVGIILIIVSLVISEEKTTTVKQEPPQQKITQTNRYCPSCSRYIPFDAKICPYCNNRFENLF